MLLSFPDLVSKYDMRINGVLHVGAHLAEEAPLYADASCGPVWWIEGNPAVLPKIEHALSPFPDQTLIHALVYCADWVELDFNVTNYDGMSSSILEFGTHTSFSPDTVFVDKVRLLSRQIDSLVAEHGIRANFLNMDLQGAELYALQGAVDFVRDQVQYVMTEVNKAEVYKGCAQIGEIDELLAGFGFKRTETYWVGNQGWGDALYVRGA